MTPLDDSERQLAEVTARLIAKAEEVGLPDPPDKLGITPRAVRLLARAYLELRGRVRALHDLVDQTDPTDPIGVGLSKAGLESRFADPSGREEHAWMCPRCSERLRRNPGDAKMLGCPKCGAWMQRTTTGAAAKPLLVVKSPEEVKALSADDLLALYCRVMRETAEVFVKYETYVVRSWDGMDSCWTDCTGEVSREEALRYWVERTDGGTRQVAYAEIDYYRIFPGGTRMHWDGSEA